MDANSVDVIAERLVNKLKSEDFLNVEERPEIEKDQEVKVIYKGIKETKKGEIFGIEVRLVVDRTQFGLDWARHKMGDEITLVGHLLYKVASE